jgi:toxin ParE1/3/4
MKVLHSGKALQNLEAIKVYIAADNPIAADRVEARLRQTCVSLPSFANRGRNGRWGTRELTTVWPYAIIYRVRGDTVRIENIVHGARRR